MDEAGFCPLTKMACTEKCMLFGVFNGYEKCAFMALADALVDLDEDSKSGMI